MAGTAQKSDPALWERVKQHVTEGDKGGEPGQWSARKAQLAVAEYKKAGGGYVGRKRADNHLSEWTREEWGTRSGKPSGETGERYLPKRARQSLTKDEYDRTTARKRTDTAKGRQFSAQPADVAPKTAAVRRGQSRKGRMEESKTDDIGREFRRLVNMTARQMRDWLETDHSREVGWTHEGESEAVGHQSGRHILELLEGKADPDEAFQRKVVGYIHRHLAQRPDGDVSETRWRFSLMNWGHDPMRDDDEMQDAQAEMPAEQQAEEGAPRKRRSSGTKASGTRKAAAPRKRASSSEAEGASPRRSTVRKTASRASGAKATGTRKASGTTAKRGATAKSSTAKSAGTRATASRSKAASGSTRKAAGTGARKASGSTASRSTGTRKASGTTAKRAAGSTAKRSTGTATRGKTTRSASSGKAASGTRKASMRSTASKTTKSGATRKASTAKSGNGTPKRSAGTRSTGTRGAAGRTAAAARGGRNSGRSGSRSTRD